AMAARLWWMLRYLGHTKVAVLDGGFARWQGGLRPLTAEVPTPTPGSFKGKPHRGMLADLGEVEKLSSARGGVLVDARAGDRYRGETEPIDRTPGHIPSAISMPFGGNLEPDGRFLPA